MAPVAAAASLVFSCSSSTTVSVSSLLFNNPLHFANSTSPLFSYPSSQMHTLVVTAPTSAAPAAPPPTTKAISRLSVGDTRLATNPPRNLNCTSSSSNSSASSSSSSSNSSNLRSSSSFTGNKLVVKSTFPATIAAPPAGFVAGCVRAMSLFGGDSNGKSSSQNEEIRRGSSGEPLYTTLAGHPVTDDNNRYVMPFFMSAERKLVVRQTFSKELQQGLLVLVLAFESLMENVCMCTHHSIYHRS